jgi:hypothetical protein
MPKPLYTICSKDWSHDRETKLVSLFHILEGYDMFVPASHEPDKIIAIPNAPTSFVGVSVWMREESDLGTDEYESEVWAIAPQQEKKVLATSVFRFERLFHRFVSVVKIQDIPAHSGFLRFGSSIRRVGTEQWLSDEFPIPINVHVVAHYALPPS